MTEIWLEIWSTVRSEFADIPDVGEATRIVLRLGMAMLLGGLLGYERERSGKDAGLRTHMLVALGAAIFVLVPLQGGMEVGDLSRVLQGVIAGIGFLGAGAIIKLSDERGGGGHGTRSHCRGQHRDGAVRAGSAAARRGAHRRQARAQGHCFRRQAVAAFQLPPDTSMNEPLV
jgi:hypothetical protein